jgi:hypothetical protein
MMENMTGAYAWGRCLLWAYILNETPWWHFRRRRKFRRAHARALANYRRPTVRRKVT